MNKDAIRSLMEDFLAAYPIVNPTTVTSVSFDLKNIDPFEGAIIVAPNSESHELVAASLPLKFKSIPIVLERVSHE